MRSSRVAILSAIVLSACGGGSGGSGGGGGGETNRAPVANAGLDQTVIEQSTVQLSGSASDPNAGDTLSYSWQQTAGSTVTLSNAASALPSFVAPEVDAGVPETLTFRLTVTDSGGLTSSDNVSVTSVEPGTIVEIAGKALYEFVPANPGCVGLRYATTEQRPMRAVTVQLIDANNNTVLGSDIADDNGDFAIAAPAATNVFLRVRSELKRGGSPSWDVEVRDNTANVSLPLSQRPIYVLDGSVFDSGATDATRNLTATTGWDGSNYTAPRAAAPFAVLDSIYSAMLLVMSAEPAASFAPLDAYWSINNSPAGTGRSNTEIQNGEIGTSFYRSDLDALFLLGKANEDTEEFDSHVIVHEWGHYFEDVFSRSDSIGGAHGIGDRLDMRVAFGEGWATALSGMVLDSTDYCDTQGTRQANGFRIDIENGTNSRRGWYNEFSIMAFLFDLWDDSVELGAGDTGSIDFASIFRTMVDRQRTIASHTSIFSFAASLVEEDPSSMSLVSDLRAYHDINGAGIYGDGETNDGNSAEPDDALPVYTEIMPNGVSVNVCSNREHDTSQAVGNRLSEHRFLRMTISVPSRYEFDIVTDAETVSQLPPDDPNSAIDQSDPDVYFYLNGNVQNVVVGGQLQGLSGEANRENFTTPNVLQPGDYVMDVVEFRHKDIDTNRAEFPARSCFDVTIQAAP